MKECPEPRSAEGIECRKCNQAGHFSRDVSLPSSTNPRLLTPIECLNIETLSPLICRNCSSEDHMAKECDQPRNPGDVFCRNCSEQGHFSRDCLEPKDWSKVQCQRCQEFGHGIKVGDTSNHPLGSKLTSNSAARLLSPTLVEEAPSKPQVVGQLVMVLPVLANARLLKMTISVEGLAKPTLYIIKNKLDNSRHYKCYDCNGYGSCSAICSVLFTREHSNNFTLQETLKLKGACDICAL